MSFNKTIINIKQFFSEYRYNLIVSLLLASLVQKVLFGRIKVEPLIFLFLFFCLLSLKKYSCYCLLIIAFVFSAMIPSAILVKTGLLTQDFLSLIVTISNEEIWFYIKSTPIQFILIASVYFALITWLVIRSRTVASHKVMGYFFILSILFAYPFYNRNHLNKIYHDWSVWKNLSSKPHKKPSWYVTKKQKAECEIYVIVLGESLRVDALSLYGNPIETTPFLKSIPTKYITHYIGTAPGTNPSIPRIFALSDSTDLNINHVENNIINIGKEAGLETFWISSQGYVGKHEVGASS
ncbi:MAG: sulfatase-like hydrolase/transferase, partial [Oxalobacter sp.]